MPLSFLNVLLACPVAFCIIATLVGYRNRRNRPPLPPGPRRLPIIGNLLNLPSANQRAWETYAEWEKLYGGIISLTVLGYNFVVLNDPEIAADLLDKRGTKYADRPQFPLFVLSGLQRFMTLMPYGPRLRENRKLVNQIMGAAQSVKKFYPAEEYQSAMLIKRVLADPDALEHAVRKYFSIDLSTASALILQIAYGYTVNEEGQDVLVGLAEDAVTTFLSMSNPSHFLINLFPSLGSLPPWFPLGTGYRQFVDRCRTCIDRMMDRPLWFVQGEMKNGTHTPSYVSDLLSSVKPGDETTIDNIRWSAASLYGGADTTVATTYSYFMAVTAYPEVQQKLQAEIDSVIGRDRLPNFEDRPALPYAEAVSKEVMRWMPVGPLGIPHLSMNDDIYEGYFIPKGTIVCANIWKYLHDPERYKEPRRFNPDRFLGPNPEQDPKDFCFGFGRRVCPGSKVAEITAWINVIKSGAALYVTKATDKHGEFIEPPCEQTPGILSHPMSFKCAIKPRHEGVVELVENAIQR